MRLVIKNTETGEYVLQGGHIPSYPAVYTDLLSAVAKLAQLQGHWQVFRVQETPVELTAAVAKQLMNL